MDLRKARKHLEDNIKSSLRAASKRASRLLEECYWFEQGMPLDVDRALVKKLMQIETILEKAPSQAKAKPWVNVFLMTKKSTTKMVKKTTSSEVDDG